MTVNVRSRVHRETYRDSVELMRVAAAVEQAPSVDMAALLMATPANRDLLEQAGLLVGEAVEARPNDLVIAVRAVGDAGAEAALDQAARLLADSADARVRSSTSIGHPVATTIAEGLAELPTANLAIVSTPGSYATAEALKALKRGLHVFMFSDNVPIEDEVELKQIARRKGLLLMGPDCGTSILDSVPIGFANAVRGGQIGLVGASGTGLQQVGCLIDRLGEGVSQAIGVGGHDLSEQVGGLMMLAGIERLAADPDTTVIVLVSKPPAAAVARRVLEIVRACGKPVVVNFLGGDPSAVREVGALPAETLEDAARLAVAVARGEPTDGRPPRTDDRRLTAIAQEQIGRFAAGQRYVRGLYSGGTLCQEAELILRGAPDGQTGHTAVDLGSDEYTVGRPHPMIDFRLRNEKIVATADDPDAAVILLDLVIGYGSHPDPAAALAPAIERARERADLAARHLVFVASVCGTPADPQNLNRQEDQLTAAGVLLAPSNVQAARLAARIAVEARSTSP